MVNQAKDHHSACVGPLSRRRFLEFGVPTACGFGLGDFLRAREKVNGSRHDTSVIFVWLPGGPPHMETYDLKPDAPSEYRGAFHLATSLRANIVPIYIHIPEEINSGMHLVSGTGRVDVYFLPLISTADWTLTELDQNRDAVRQLYVDFHAKRGSSQ